MPNATPPRTRLFVDGPLAEGSLVTCDEKRAHYLLHVLRLQEGAGVVVFNGQDGEWLAHIGNVHKKSASLIAERQLREQQNVPDISLFITPLKNGRTDWVVEKATELGVKHICPVTTRFTSVHRTNTARLNAIAVEAAEQCERMDVPKVEDLSELSQYLERWNNQRTLVYADESGAGSNTLAQTLPRGPLALLIGPEGGFSKEEFALLRELPFAKAISLGPRILRADTAAITALSVIQSATGDWKHKPAFRNQEDG